MKIENEKWSERRQEENGSGTRGGAYLRVKRFAGCGCVSQACLEKARKKPRRKHLITGNGKKDSNGE